jgi:SAM-dependent methyltransferase
MRPVNRTDGFDGSPADAEAIWATNAAKWPHIGPPWRPSMGDIAHYRRLAAPALPGRALVLGATPELRDLLAEHAGRMPRPVVVDRSLPMLQAMTSLMHRARAGQECWRLADWRSLELEPASFDLVLADMVWWTVSVADQAALRDRIARLLVPDGIFVSRFRFRDPALAGRNPGAVFDRYLAQLDAASDREQQVRDAMLSELYDVTVDAARRRMDRERARACIAARRDVATDARHRSFLEVTLTRLIGADWTSQTRDEILPGLLERFAPIAEAHASDYDAGRYPVIALRKTSAAAVGR